MAGGALQWPIWKPYEIYASIDHVYGWPGWENNDGFGGAQGVLNAVEVVLYGLYAMIIYNHSAPAAGGTGLQLEQGFGKWLSGGRKVRGLSGNRALIIGFAAAVMTLSKTVLYCAYKNKSMLCERDTNTTRLQRVLLWFCQRPPQRLG
jgi:hypothetical protein